MRVFFKKPLKKLFGISLSLLLVMNMIGKPLLEYYQEEVKSSLSEETVFFEENGDKLTVKVPFQLPYQSASYNFEDVQDVVVYKGNFYRTVKRVFENDTLYTQLKKESIDRSNLFDMVSQVTKNYDKKPVDPIQNIIDILKTFSSNYHTTSVSYYAFFWTDWLKFSHTEPISLYHSHAGVITAPPPRC